MILWIEGAREELLQTIGVVDALIINDAEARELAQESNLIRAARKILTLGPQLIVVKRGEYGAAYFTRDSFFATPAFPLESVFDPTGAGDSFAGGFMGYLAQAGKVDDHTLRRAVIYGSVMASYNVEEFSCDRLRRLQEEEIQDRFRLFKEFTHFEI
jgi:sugar/nucleoside kinase (ribokinase family)